jgi:hypothetical protein
MWKTDGPPRLSLFFHISSTKKGAFERLVPRRFWGFSTVFPYYDYYG